MEDFDKDYWMDAQEAIAYGIADALAPTHMAPSGSQ
jgi:ATP-dependent protease ClpP protease subunit